jgi:DNA-directed RNA polymerase specialized sigma24 family protein
VLKRSRNSNAGTGSSAELLFEQYLGKVFSYISFRVNNTQLAEDLTLQVLKGFFCQAGHGCRDSENLPVSLFTAARTLLLGNLPRAALPVSGVPPEAGKGAQLNLRAGLERLSPQEKDIVALKLGPGLSNRCIGRILGLSEADVGMNLCRALNKLNGCLCNQA